MSDEVPVVWLEDGDSREDAVRALREWASVRGIRLGAVEEHAGAPTTDPPVADRVERELERARLAIGADDADGAERALARAELALREHPELPQAAWLRAEVERAWSARWLRLAPQDTVRARVAWENADALDGGRVPGVGETTFAPRPKLKTTIAVEGAAPTALTLLFDGAPLEPSLGAHGEAEYRVEVAPAEHHLVATFDGRIAFASWIAIADATPVRVSLSGGACERHRLGAVRRAADVVEAPGVTCPRWVAAVPGERSGSVLVARCEADACGPLLEWRMERLPGSMHPEDARRLARWPSWATWTIVGIGAATVASMALVATGALEARPVEPRFVVGGARQE